MSQQFMRILALGTALLWAQMAAAQTPPVIGAPPADAKPAAASPAAASPAAAEYLLGPEDVVEIEVVGTNDKARARIYTDGTIQTSLGGRVEAGGKTPSQLGQEIARVLKAGGFYANPVVNVEVASYASRYVTVLGAVGQPGLVPVNRTYHLSEILARVGGVRGDAADYLIVRTEAGQEKRYSVEKLAAGDPSQDPTVAAGDKIFSPVADVFYISGQVRSPGTYPLKSGTTIAQAIAKSGGLTESGTDKSVKVRRGDKVVKLKANDPVEAGDVLTIGERLF